MTRRSSTGGSWLLRSCPLYGTPPNGIKGESLNRCARRNSCVFAQYFLHTEMRLYAELSMLFQLEQFAFWGVENRLGPVYIVFWPSKKCHARSDAPQFCCVAPHCKLPEPHIAVEG